MRQLDQRPHVQIDHTKLGLKAAVLEGAGRTKSRIVDEDIDIEAALAECLGKLRACIGPAKIVRDWHYAHAKLGREVCCRRIERPGRAGGEHEAIAVAGKAACKLKPDAAAGPRDKGRLPFALALVFH